MSRSISWLIESRESNRYLYTCVQSNVFHSSQKEEIIQVSIKRNKVLYYPMEYYSVLKRNEILIYATMWMNPENIMLSEISQSQKDKYCMIPLTRGKFTEAENRTMISMGCGTGGKGSYYLMGTKILSEKKKIKILSGMTKMFQKQMVVMVVQKCECT